ncbi:hypothetical protein Tsubulata_044570 [Turnera subulata]|uniref:non-specific serine/threonine protein kinase n=1 Tax=Turnera subulata TaxID=218843 RepID=A0A9Q0G9X1_9ROSI|nr:hypothetical protein Tsubulata_044570 [Turnera subulata]
MSSSPLSAPPPAQPPVDIPAVNVLAPSSPPLVDVVTTSTPPVDSASPPPLVVNHTPPPLPQAAPPFASPPAPAVEVLPPTIPPAITSPSIPQPAVVPVTSPPPVISPSLLPPPVLPPLEAAPPPKADTFPLTPPVNSPPLPPQPSIPATTPPAQPLPTNPPLPTSAPPPTVVDPLFPAQPVVSLPSPVPPLIPTTSSPPLTSPPSLEASPPAPPTGPTTLLPTHAWPSYPPPEPAPILEVPTPPSGSTISSPLPLPLNGGSVPVSSKQSHTSTGIIIGCFIGGVFVLLLLGLLCICYRHRRTRNSAKAKPQFLLSKDNSNKVVQPQQDGSSNGSVIGVQTKTFPLPAPSIGMRGSPSRNAGHGYLLPTRGPHVALEFSSGTFTYHELMEATDGFSDANLLGQGGFGYVHKGVLPSGKEVAVKQLKDGSRQGEREFQTEVDIISQVHHKHLVTLVGYCIAGPARLLVYEFVSNNTLEFHLYGTGQPVMEWKTRLRIAIGSAKGLAYLHEDCNPTIIHRDIKASNILLDQEFNAKVSDFGLAKSFSNANGSTVITHISTQVVGTFGYLAPEYASSGKVTEKSDVYSFGVVLLELITGRPPISATESVMNQSLVAWARPLLNQALEEGKFDALVDPKLETKYDFNQMASMVACAAACVRHSAWLRPRMSQIVCALEGDISAKDLCEGIVRPGHSTFLSSSRSSNSSSFQHNYEVNNFNGTPSNFQFGTGRYTGTTSEYGLDLSSSSSDATCR